MYKTFAKERMEAFRQAQKKEGDGTSTKTSSVSVKFLGMHATRCFLGALKGYERSGWLAAEEYACTVLPTEVTRFLLLLLLLLV